MTDNPSSFAARSASDSSRSSSRRQFLASNAFGIGSFALAALLRDEGLLASPPGKPVENAINDLQRRSPEQLRPVQRA